MKRHVTHMLIAGGAILVVLLVLEVDLGAALPYALALACPLGMLFMMKGHGGGHDHGGRDHSAHSADATTPEPPLTRENRERIV